MSNEALKIISESLESIGINYEFGTWSGKIVYPYFTGEYQEVTPMNEDGMQESTFILTGFSRDSWLALEDAKLKIKKKYNKTDGLLVIAEDGTAVAIFYGNSQIIPTVDAELKKIQINLVVKEWSV